jgi:oxaloacetate decarboxylase gamma subunit
MDIASLLLQAANLMLTGMVGVFVFLSILIFVVQKLARFAGDEPINEQVVKRTPRPANNGVSTAHIAAISAAITQYRTKK